MDSIFHIRPLRPDDSMADLTALLHRAYGALAGRGMHFLASHQDEATTRRRIGAGQCWVAVAEDKIVGTIVLRDAARTRGSPWYERPEVASFGQFAVEPMWQNRGIGSRLVEQVEQRAAEMKVVELALDTAETADDLIRFYTRRGYRFIEYVKWDVVNYRSVLMSKRLG